MQRFLTFKYCESPMSKSTTEINATLKRKSLPDPSMFLPPSKLVAAAMLPEYINIKDNLPLSTLRENALIYFNGDGGNDVKNSWKRLHHIVGKEFEKYRKFVIDVLLLCEERKKIFFLKKVWTEYKVNFIHNETYLKSFILTISQHECYTLSNLLLSDNEAVNNIIKLDNDTLTIFVDKIKSIAAKDSNLKFYFDCFIKKIEPPKSDGKNEIPIEENVDTAQQDEAAAVILSTIGH